MAEKKDNSQIHAGHRSRMKQLFIKNGGFNGFADHNILEMLLFYSIPRKDTNELAHMLIKHFGSYEKVLEADYDELIKVKGISERSACLIKMIIPLYFRYIQSSSVQNNLFESYEKLYDYIHTCYSELQQVRASVLCLDGRLNFIVNDDVTDTEDTDHVFHIMKTMRAVTKSHALGVIMVHNRLDGVAQPTQRDIEETQKIKTLLSSIGVYLYDHIIVARDQHYSMMNVE